MLLANDMMCVDLRKHDVARVQLSGKACSRHLRPYRRPAQGQNAGARIPLRQEGYGSEGIWKYDIISTEIVALMKPLDSFKGAAGNNRGPFFGVRLGAFGDGNQA